MGIPKFKVGDIVEVLDGRNIKHYTGGWGYGVKRHVGEIKKIRDIVIFPDDRVAYRLADLFVIFDERGLKKVKHKNESIVIYRKDNEVVALNKATGETATARCNPIDTFDFNIGAKLAFERLMGIEEPVEQGERKPYNGKVVCIKVAFGNRGAHTLGKIYEIKNGKLILDNGNTVPISSRRFYSVEDLNLYSSSEWLEIVE
jgi:hypothetical protein